MSIQYENALLNIYDGLDKNDFRINSSLHHVFVCGGIVDIANPFPPSFRDRFFRYIAQQDDVLLNSLIAAEKFKDYFKENAYTDLFIFESDIASISEVIMIFLESPGSLVELGIFCAKPELYKKLMIIAPAEEIHQEDSFIYLGPLENIKKKNKSSVLVYPWPDKLTQNYNTGHLEDIYASLSKKLSSIPNSMQFKESEPGHIAFLISEIIRIGYPITITEIDISIYALDLEVEDSLIKRSLYLLTKLEIIKKYHYSGYDFYHPVNKETILVKFNAGKKFDAITATMKLRQAYVLESDDSSRKRKNVLTEINKFLGVS